jgi:hypothetical protein
MHFTEAYTFRVCWSVVNTPAGAGIGRGDIHLDKTFYMYMLVHAQTTRSPTLPDYWRIAVTHIDTSCEGLTRCRIQYRQKRPRAIARMGYGCTTSNASGSRRNELSQASGIAWHGIILAQHILNAYDAGIAELPTYSIGES